MIVVKAIGENLPSVQAMFIDCRHTNEECFGCMKKRKGANEDDQKARKFGKSE